LFGASGKNFDDAGWLVCELHVAEYPQRCGRSSGIARRWLAKTAAQTAN
jgi:hypothetical protein